MNKIYFSLAVLLIISSCKTTKVVSDQSDTVMQKMSSADIIHKEVTQRGIKSHIQFLSSDALRGRDTGSEGLEAAAAYIGANFDAAGVAEVNGTHFQPVPFVTFSPPKEAELSIGLSLIHISEPTRPY